MTRRTKIAGLLVCSLAIVGCGPGHPPVDTLVPQSQVVAEYNANAAKVPRLWARAKVVRTSRAKPGQLGLSWGSTMEAPNGLLLLNKTTRPGQADFILQIKELGNRIGQLGTSTAEGVYYFWLNLGQRKICRWGLLTLAGAPETKTALPIDPTELLAVLGICQLPAGQKQPPFMGQRISFDPPAYVLTFVERETLTGKYKFRREVYFHWSQTKPRRPFMVKVFNDLGLAVLTATMKNYQPVAGDTGRDEKSPAMMPTDITIKWLQTGSRLRLVLSDMTSREKFDPDVFLLKYAIPQPMRALARQCDATLAGPKHNTLPPISPPKGDEPE
jgi:hypothetical protein